MRTKPTTIVLTVLIILGILAAGAAVFVTTTGAFRVSDIRTTSMAPAVGKNSLAITQRVPLSDVHKNDIISVRTTLDNNQDVLGRVKSITLEKGTHVYDYNIQADNNPLPDQWGYKSSGNTYKTIAVIPFLGLVPVFLQTAWGAGLVLALVLALAILYLVKMHVPLSAESRAKRARVRAEFLRDENDSHDGVEAINALFAERALEN